MKISLFGLNTLNVNNNNNNNDFLRPKTNNDESDIPSHSATSEVKKDDTFDEDYPELNLNN